MFAKRSYTTKQETLSTLHLSLMFSYMFLLQDLGQNLATPHTVDRLAAEYRDEHKGSPPLSCKLQSNTFSLF